MRVGQTQRGVPRPAGPAPFHALMADRERPAVGSQRLRGYSRLVCRDLFDKNDPLWETRLCREIGQQVCDMLRAAERGDDDVDSIRLRAVETVTLMLLWHLVTQRGVPANQQAR